MEPVNSVVIDLMIEDEPNPDALNHLPVERRACYHPSSADKRFECTVITLGKSRKILATTPRFSWVRVVGTMQGGDIIQAEYLHVTKGA